MSHLSLEPYLELSLLGSPEVRLNGQNVVSGPTKKTQALLFFLATTQKTHHREKLSAIFWPNAPVDRARKNLRDALFHLRKQFAPFLTTTPHNVAFDFSNNFTFDVQLFRSEFSQPTSDIPGERRTIANLYRGEFLQGFSLHDAPLFDDWVSAERESLHHLAVQGLARLIPHTLIHDPIQDGLALCNQLLLMEPWNEDALLAKLKLLNRSGQRLAAIQQYHTYCALIEAEFGIEPAETIQNYYDQMMAGVSPSSSLLPPNSLRRRQHDTIQIPHNLEPSLGSFIGRQWEIQQLLQHLHNRDTRLLTIVGLGGMGKTTLAQQVAHLILEQENESHIASSASHFSDGIYFISLASVYPNGDASAYAHNQGKSITESLSHSVITAISDAIGLRMFGQVPPLEQLLTSIRDQKLLLILDNFDHLTSAASIVSQLLEQAPNLRLIITSRQRLNLAEEKLLELRGLSWQSDGIPHSVLYKDPDYVHLAYTQIAYNNSQRDIEEQMTSDAVNLFVRSAQLVDDRLIPISPRTTYSTSPQKSENIDEISRIGRNEHESIMAPIRQICELVEGMPLAIELAASLARTTPIKDIAKILVMDYDILLSELDGVNEGHRSIRIMLDTSWRMLTPTERQVLARLTLFRGGFTISAAKAVASATEKILAQLMDKSFIHLVDGEVVDGKIVDGRYDMHILIRRYAAEQLRINTRLDISSIQELLQAYYVTLLCEQISEWQHTGKESIIDRLQREADNLTTTWELLHSSGNLRLCLSYLDNLWRFYRANTRLAEAITIAEEGLTAIRKSSANESSVVAVGTKPTVANSDTLHPHSTLQQRCDKQKTTDSYVPTMIDSAKLLWYLSETYFELGQLQKSNQYAWRALKELGYRAPKTPSHQLIAAVTELGKQLFRRQWSKHAIVMDTDGKYTLAARAYFRLQNNCFINDTSTPLVYYGLCFVKLANKSSDTTLRGLAYAQMSVLCGLMRMNRLAEKYITLADQLILESSDRSAPNSISDQIIAAECIGLYNFSIGRTADAEQRFSLAYELCRKIGDLSNVGECIVMLHSLALRRGDVAQSMAYADLLESYAKAHHNAAHTGWSLLISAISSLESGEADRALLTLEQALPLTEKMIMRDLGHAVGYSAQALAYFRIGDHKRAKHTADIALAGLEKSIPMTANHLFCLDALLMIYSSLWERAVQRQQKPLSGERSADPKEYQQITDKMIRMLVRFGWHHPIAKPYIHYYRGRYIFQRGDEARAIFKWQAGLAAANAQSNLPLAARLQYEIGRCLISSTRLGSEYLEEAKERFTEYKMLYDLALVEQSIMKNNLANTEEVQEYPETEKRRFRLESKSAAMGNKLKVN